ncbi:hypothetical protein KKF29_01955 [Patescibacteria group bacterium]|nr:hypothetical protein [Patescibacteria group bacterium]
MKKLILYSVILSVVLTSFVFVIGVNAEANLGYKLEVPLPPGVTTVSGLPQYIGVIYNFSIGLLAILALLMVVFGGFSWITAAGNETKITAAKTTVVQAIIGLVIGLGSFVLLTTINPNLVTFSFSIPNIETSYSGSTSSSGSGGTGGTPPTCEYKTNSSASSLSGWYPVGEDVSLCSSPPGTIGNGNDEYKCYCEFHDNCQPVTSGDCSVANLQTTCMGDNAYMASAICGRESGGTANIGENCSPSSCTDYCSNDPQTRGFSFGLFQINLIANNISLASGGSQDCKSVFSNYQNKYQTEGKFYCDISSDAEWNDCMTIATNPDNNILTACGLSQNGKRWGNWSANAHCGFPN